MAQRKFIIDGGFKTDDASELLANLTMGGTIDMADNKLLNVATPTAAGDGASMSYVDAQVAALVNGAPGALDTLNELAAAMADDAAFSATVTNSLALKSDITYVDAQITATETYADTEIVASAAALTTAFQTADTALDTAYKAADVVVTNAMTSYADTAEADAISTAASDATTKANAAQAAAIADSDAADVVVTTAYVAADAAVTANYIAADTAQTTSVNAAWAAGDAAVTTAMQTYADQAEADAESAAATDATTKADAAQTAAIASAASDATTKANAARTGAVSDVTNGAGAAFDTLVEIQNAMATDAELSSAIASVTSSAASTAAADATTKANAALASALAADVTNNNQLTNGAGYITGYTDTNTTYTAGNGMTLSGTSFLMSGSYTGNFTATGDITAYSDDSLKTNVQVIDGALGRVEAIRGVTFERIEDGSVSTGVIAQELKAVLPEAVHTDANGVHSVAYGNITGLLIEAVKELSAQVAELKAK